MRTIFLIVSGLLFALSIYGGTSAPDAISANATRVLIASGLFAIAGMLA